MWLRPGVVITDACDLTLPVVGISVPVSQLRLTEISQAFRVRNMTSAGWGPARGLGGECNRTATFALQQPSAQLNRLPALPGHSSVAITGDVYGHVMPETARAASDVMAGLLG